MKLLFTTQGIYEFATNSPRSAGGAQRQQWLLARAMARRGHESVVAVQTGQPEDLQPEIDGVRFVAAQPGRLLISLFRLVRRERPDWWYWRIADYRIGPLFLWARLLGISTIFAAALDRDCTPRHGLRRNPRLWPFYAWGLRLADRIVVQHQNQLDRLPIPLASKASIVTNIVDIEPPVEPKTGYVAWVAAIRHQKRADRLIELAHHMPETRFVMGGPFSESDILAPPVYREQVRRGIASSPNIDYRGPLSAHDARAVIYSADVFLSTSEYEGLPNTMLEAWSGAVPVVAWGVDPGGIITRHQAGLHAHTDTATIEALRALLDDPARRQALGENGLAYVKQHHVADRVGMALEKAIGL